MDGAREGGMDGWKDGEVLIGLKERYSVHQVENSLMTNANGVSLRVHVWLCVYVYVCVCVCA